MGIKKRGKRIMYAELSKTAKFGRVLVASGEDNFLERQVSQSGFNKKQIEVMRRASGVISEPNINLNKIRDYLSNGED